MTTYAYAFNTGHFMNTPSPFDCDRFELWKDRFEIFIKEIYFEVWNILINGLFIPTFSLNDKVVNKSDFHWTKEDKKKGKLGFKVKHIFINALGSKEFYYVFTCDFSKEV